jgi:hypothetical protein
MFLSIQHSIAGCPDTMKSCIFCKNILADVGRAREHIFPIWLQKEWKSADWLVAPTHFDVDLNILSQRRQTFGSLLAGHICASCNNGWMSALEHLCKDLILDLAYGRRRILELTHAEALALARWTVKTSFALHTSSNWRPVVPPDHIYKLDMEDYRLPERVYVIGHTYKTSRDFSWAQTTTAQVIARNGNVSPSDEALIRARAYKIAIRLGGLFLMVFHNPLPHALPCLWRGRHVPLYPRWSAPVTWQVTNRPWPKKPEVRFHTFVTMAGLTIDEQQSA